MRYMIAVIALVTLSGCANVNGVMTPTLLGSYFDNQDPCQREGTIPSFCGKGTKSFVTVNGEVFVVQ